MSRSENDTADPIFLALPSRLQKQIDRAFDKACEEDSTISSNAPRKRRRMTSHSKASDLNAEDGGFAPGSSPAPGGFLIDDGDEPIGGGFIPEDVATSDGGGFVPPSTSISVDGDDAEDAEFTHIPFHLIPRALQLLDLQPDDEDVLDVFRNAASGWEATSRASRSKEDQEKELCVSRKDWRAVCAALLDTSAQEAGDGDDSQGDDLMDVDESEPSEEDYVGSEDQSEDEEEEDSEDEYQGGFVRSTPRGKDKGKGKAKATPPKRKTRSRKASYSPELSDDEAIPKQLTPRQKAEARRTFALFFPEVSDSDLDGKRIMIKDVSRVAELLKEKITVEEIVEMLEAFSTSPDKSMSLSDFGTMMVVAKLA